MKQIDKGYKVGVADPAEVNAELIGWLKQAYDNAG